VVDSISVEAKRAAAAALPADSLDAALVEFRALADPTRLRILEFLGRGERCACDLGEAVDVPANLLSHHLKVLRQAGLIVATRRGRWIDYRLHSEALRGLGHRLAAIADAPPSCPLPSGPAPVSGVVG
jgi:ArsR family transcriptional regulator